MILLNGIRVVELTEGIAGPYAGMIFADLGADVVKVEPPKGDPTRDKGPFLQAATFAAYNRNKKSLAVDLESKEGKKLISKLVEGSDILLESLDPHVADGLGLSYEDVSKLNPKIIYVSIRGSVSKEYEDEPESNLLIEARSWATAAQGDKWESDSPCRSSWPIFPCAAGLYAAIGAMGSVLNRAKTGKGEKIIVGILESAYMCRRGGGLGHQPSPVPGQKHAGSGGGNYMNFKTTDGWIFVSARTKMWYSFCDEVGISEEDKKKYGEFAMRRKTATTQEEREWEKVIQEAIGKLSTAVAFEKIHKADSAGAPVTTMKEIAEDPHLAYTRFFVKLTPDSSVTLTSKPKTFLAPMLPILSDDYNPDTTGKWTPPPKLGEHTAEVMRKLGYTKEQIADLQKRKVVGPYK